MVVHILEAGDTEGDQTASQEAADQDADQAHEVGEDAIVLLGLRQAHVSALLAGHNEGELVHGGLHAFVERRGGRGNNHHHLAIRSLLHRLHHRLGLLLSLHGHHYLHLLLLRVKVLLGLVDRCRGLVHVILNRKVRFLAGNQSFVIHPWYYFIIIN